MFLIHKYLFFWEGLGVVGIAVDCFKDLAEDWRRNWISLCPILWIDRLDSVVITNQCTFGN